MNAAFDLGIHLSVEHLVQLRAGLLGADQADDHRHQGAEDASEDADPPLRDLQFLNRDGEQRDRSDDRDDDGCDSHHHDGARLLAVAPCTDPEAADEARSDGDGMERPSFRPVASDAPQPFESHLTPIGGALPRFGTPER